MTHPHPQDKAAACAELSKSMVTLVLGVSRWELSKASRSGPAAAFARQVAMYLTHVVFAVSMTGVGRAFGRDRATVAHACRVVEAARENSEIDSTLERMSVALTALTRPALFGGEREEHASC